MRDILIVMKFTMKEIIKRKSFIISTLIILILIVVGFNIPNIINAFESEDTGDKLFIVDSNDIFEGNLELLNQMDLGYEIEIGEATFDEIKEKITNDEISDAIIIEKQDNNIKIRYIVENTVWITEVPETIINAINTLYTNIQISKLGLSEEELLSITPNFEFSIEQTEDEEVSGNVFAMMLMCMILFYAIYFCAYQVSTSITTEKTSRIMETLVTSTSPKTIVIGKTIGIGIVGLLQLVLIVETALVSAKVFVDQEILDLVLDMSNITIYLGVITIIYFILGYLTYALLYALTGSTVSKPEDVQSANTLVAILAVIGFYLAYFTMMNPTSNFNVFASVFPLSSPFCMPFRVMMGLASSSDVVISIAILIITILIIAKIAIKIYSNAILNYGTKMSFKDILNIYKYK